MSGLLGIPPLGVTGPRHVWERGPRTYRVASLVCKHCRVVWRIDEIGPAGACTKPTTERTDQS